MLPGPWRDRRRGGRRIGCARGGCPGNFFTGRKWTYEHGMLIIRNYKGEPLAELAFANGRFEGKATNGAAVTLAH